jgi:hypothetical protein
MVNLYSVAIGVGDVSFTAGHIFGMVYRRYFNSAGQQMLAQASQVSYIHAQHHSLSR